MAKYWYPSCLRGRHHLLDRIAAVAPPGVRVQVAAYVQRREQLGEPVLLGRFDLVAAFAQFRGHVGQPQVAIQVVLGRARHVPARVGQHALIEHQPAGPGAGHQALHVRVRAGVPGQRRPGLIGRGDEHLDGAALGDHRDAGGRTAEHRGPPRQDRQRVEHVGMSVRGCRGKQRHALDRRRVAAHASDGCQLIDRRPGSSNFFGDERCKRVGTPERNPCEWRQRSLPFCLDSVGAVYDGGIRGGLVRRPICVALEAPGPTRRTGERWLPGLEANLSPIARVDGKCLGQSDLHDWDRMKSSA